MIYKDFSLVDGECDLLIFKYLYLVINYIDNYFEIIFSVYSNYNCMCNAVTYYNTIL